MEIHEEIELIAYLYFDGKIEQGSKFEKMLYKAIIAQIENDSNISARTLALCWIYLQAYSREPLGKSIEVGL